MRLLFLIATFIIGLHTLNVWGFGLPSQFNGGGAMQSAGLGQFGGASGGSSGAASCPASSSNAQLLRAWKQCQGFFSQAQQNCPDASSVNQCNQLWAQAYQNCAAAMQTATWS